MLLFLYASVRTSPIQIPKYVIFQSKFGLGAEAHGCAGQTWGTVQVTHACRGTQTCGAKLRDRCRSLSSLLRSFAKLATTFLNRCIEDGHSAPTDSSNMRLDRLESFAKQTKLYWEKCEAKTWVCYIVGL